MNKVLIIEDLGLKFFDSNCLFSILLPKKCGDIVSDSGLYDYIMLLSKSENESIYIRTMRNTESFSAEPELIIRFMIETHLTDTQIYSKSLLQDFATRFNYYRANFDRSLYERIEHGYLRDLYYLQQQCRNMQQYIMDI